MKVSDRTAFVNGVDHGLGRSFVQELPQTVAAREPRARWPWGVTAPQPLGVLPEAVDATNYECFEALAMGLPDLDLVISNAGIRLASTVIKPDANQSAQTILGVYALVPPVRAFAPGRQVTSAAFAHGRQSSNKNGHGFRVVITRTGTRLRTGFRR